MKYVNTRGKTLAFGEGRLERLWQVWNVTMLECPSTVKSF